MKLQKSLENKLSCCLNLQTMSNFKFMVMIQFVPSTSVAVKIFSSNFCSQRASGLPDPPSWNTSSGKESAETEESAGQVSLSVSSNLLILCNACLKSSNLQNEVAVVIFLSLSSWMSLLTI